MNSTRRNHLPSHLGHFPCWYTKCMDEKTYTYSIMYIYILYIYTSRTSQSHLPRCERSWGSGRTLVWGRHLHFSWLSHLCMLASVVSSSLKPLIQLVEVELSGTRLDKARIPPEQMMCLRNTVFHVENLNKPCGPR